MDSSGGLLQRVFLFLVLAIFAGTGCAYRVGAGLTAGVLDEISGEGRSEGVETMGDRVLERALLVELGHQLGSGLSSGATEVTPDQQAALESVIDGLLTVAATRTGQGLRNEVSPELREMVRKDIVGAFADGLENELGDSLEKTIDRVVTQAIVSLRRGMNEEDTRYATSDLLRDSVYFAMREGQGGTPAVAETIEFTLVNNLLEPLEQSVGGLTDVVATRVEDSARRTEANLKSVIAALLFVGGVLAVLYVARGWQLQRAQESSKQAAQALGGVDAALSLLDENTRAEVQKRLDEYQTIAQKGDPINTPLPPKRRGDDYMR